MEIKKIKKNEMIYSSEPVKEPIILADGQLLGVEFAIVNCGTHPCSYIKLQKNSKFSRKKYSNIPIQCHGGLTFKGKRDFLGKGTLIGWDYMHAWDYVGYYDSHILKNTRKFNKKQHKWTTDELLNEMCMVIQQIRIKSRREFFGIPTKER